MKTGKIIFWSLLGVTVIGGGAYVYFKYFHKPKPKTKDDFKKTTDETGVTVVTDKTTGETWGVGNDNLPLVNGSFGENVVALQKHINKLTSEGLTEDGKLGNQTESALKKIGYSIPMTPTVYYAFLQKTSLTPSVSTMGGGKYVPLPIGNQTNSVDSLIVR